LKEKADKKKNLKNSNSETDFSNWKYRTQEMMKWHF
jgi:hypothetical protein